MVLIGTVATLASIFVSPAAVRAATNTNPIDWHINSTYYGPKGQDIPLRVGQHDEGSIPGFGIRHVEDGHGLLPSVNDLGDTLEFGNCQYQSSNHTYQCVYDSSGGPVVAIYTERVDSRSGDGRPVGIITAYYQECDSATPLVRLRYMRPDC